MDGSKLWFVVKTLLVFFLLSWVVSGLLFSRPLGNVALIPVSGTILVDGSSPFAEDVSSSGDIVGFIQDAGDDPSIEAIVLWINSPGGSAVASKEIVDAVRSVNKTAVAVIREVGASGAYWVASAADHVFASEMSITGSIGVISSYVELAGLLRRYNMSYQRLVAGEYKDIGDPFKELGQDERDLLQSKLDIIHGFFIRSVAENRALPVGRVRELATGEFFLGVEAVDLGLVDEIGGLDSAKRYLEKELNTTVEFSEFSKGIGLSDLFFGFFSEQSFSLGRGIGYELKSSSDVPDLRMFT